MSTKPHLLLLHGALGAATQFQQLAERLSDHYTVHTMDFPGHGGKPFPESALKMPVLAEHLADFVNEFHLQGCIVFGYSMGGYAALWLEHNEPGTFEKIITLGTKLDWNPDSSEREAKMLDPQKMQEKIPGYVKQLQERHGDQWSRLCEETADMLRHLGLHGMTPLDFSELELPVRLMLGDRDQMVSLEETIRVFRELPKGSLQIFPDTVHLLEKVNPEMLEKAIRNFA
jgi:pimeloyl-ACP methyl ester carboxylesterase